MFAFEDGLNIMFVPITLFPGVGCIGAVETPLYVTYKFESVETLPVIPIDNPEIFTPSNGLADIEYDHSFTFVEIVSSFWYVIDALFATLRDGWIVVVIELLIVKFIGLLTVVCEPVKVFLTFIWYVPFGSERTLNEIDVPFGTTVTLEPTLVPPWYIPFWK